MCAVIVRGNFIGESRCGILVLLTWLLVAFSWIESKCFQNTEFGWDDYVDDGVRGGTKRGATFRGSGGTKVRASPPERAIFIAKAIWRENFEGQ